MALGDELSISIQYARKNTLTPLFFSAQKKAIARVRRKNSLKFDFMHKSLIVKCNDEFNAAIYRKTTNLQMEQHKKKPHQF